MSSISLEEMLLIVKSLKTSGLAFVEPDSLKFIQQNIKNLPSSEEINNIYTTSNDHRLIEKLCSDVGKIMKDIDEYGSQGLSYQARYKVKTKLSPRYKTL